MLIEEACDLTWSWWYQSVPTTWRNQPHRCGRFLKVRMNIAMVVLYREAVFTLVTRGRLFDVGVKILPRTLCWIFNVSAENDRASPCGRLFCSVCAELKTTILKQFSHWRRAVVFLRSASKEQKKHCSQWWKF